MVCEHCNGKISPEFAFCPHCGRRLGHADSQGTPTRRARLLRWLRQRLFPLLILLVVIAFGVLGLALTGFRDGVQERALANRHQAEIHYNRGEVYLELGQYQLAEAEFEEALRLVPNYQAALEKRRIARLKQTVTPSPTPEPTLTPTPTATVPTPTAAVVVVPKREVLFSEGRAYYENHEWKQAIAKLEQLRSEDVTYQADAVKEMLFQSYYQYGMQLDEQGLLEEAIAQYDRALSLRPGHPEIKKLRRRADLYQSALDVWGVKWESALDYLTALYAIAPDYKDTAERLYQVCLTHAQTLIKQERYCSAAKLYRQALDIRDDDPKVVKLEDDTRHLCQVTTPTPLGTPTADLSDRQGKVHLGTLVATCYDHQANQYNICAQDADDNELRVWITLAEQPALTTDGRFLAYRSTAPERPGLYALDVISNTVITITTVAEAYYPTWSPDGGQVAYALYDTDAEEWFIYIAKLEAQASPRRIHQGEWPSWGPDGLLAFTTCTGEEECGIHIYDPKSGTLHRLTASRQDRAAAWSPSGDEIVYMSDVGRSLNLYVVHAKSGYVRQITRNLFADTVPIWSPDGQRIAFVTNRDDNWSVYTIHPYGGQAKHIAILGAGSAEMSAFRLAWVGTVIATGKR